MLKEDTGGGTAAALGSAAEGQNEAVGVPGDVDAGTGAGPSSHAAEGESSHLAHSPEPEARSYTAAPPPEKRSRNAEYQARMRMQAKYRFDDLNEIPPLEIDEEGFTLKPPAVYPSRRRKFSLAEQKVHFILMWNHSAGNVTLSCQYAGVKRPEYEGWKLSDPLFRQKMAEAQLEVADRAQFRLAQRIGLVKTPPNISVHDSALFAYVKRFCPGMGMEESAPAIPVDANGTQESRSNIPRPTR